MPGWLLKIGLFLLFVPMAAVSAGMFGALHDQISYTVSAEYFTRFKFIQFGLLDAAVPERWRAAIVGYRASWWMGIPLGVLCGLAGFIQRSPGSMLRALLWSLPFLAAFTLAAALVGLAYGWLQTATLDPVDYRGWRLPQDVQHLRRYLCAGYMHNAAYLGGALSIPAAWLFHIAFRLRSRPEPAPPQP
jgi:hypothetical protein